MRKIWDPIYNSIFQKEEGMLIGGKHEINPNFWRKSLTTRGRFGDTKLCHFIYATNT